MGDDFVLHNISGLKKKRESTWGLKLAVPRFQTWKCGACTNDGDLMGEGGPGGNACWKITSLIGQ